MRAEVEAARARGGAQLLERLGLDLVRGRVRVRVGVRGRGRVSVKVKAWGWGLGWGWGWGWCQLGLGLGFGLGPGLGLGLGLGLRPSHRLMPAWSVSLSVGTVGEVHRQRTTMLSAIATETACSKRWPR